MSHRRPDIRIWEQHDLERLVSQNPLVAVRLYPKALTPEGQCEVMKTKFWEYITYTDVPTLKTLWKCRYDFVWSKRSLFAALASECATGDLTKRPWSSIISEEHLWELYVEALINGAYLTIRAASAGSRIEPVMDALAHLLTRLLATFEASAVAKLTESAFDLTENLADLPDKAKQLIIQPVVARMFYQVAENCLEDCVRVMTLGGSRIKEERRDFWQQFRNPANDDIDSEKPKGLLYLEVKQQPCNAGLPLSKKFGCPMISFDSKLPLKKLFERIKPVIVNRMNASLSPKSDESQ